MEVPDILLIRQVFGLSALDLARALGVVPITVTRWETGKVRPTGLQVEVLHGLYVCALGARNDPEKRERIAALLKLGIGSLIAYMLDRTTGAPGS